MRGLGQLSVEEQQASLSMLRGGVTQQAVADGFGVTKNTIAGLWHRQGEPKALREPGTLWTRCAALHARLDAVLSENAGVGKLPPKPMRAR